jgi:hypothetical protein
MFKMDLEFEKIKFENRKIGYPHTFDNSVNERVECDSFMELMVWYISKNTRLSLQPGVKTAVRNWA